MFFESVFYIFSKHETERNCRSLRFRSRNWERWGTSLEFAEGVRILPGPSQRNQRQKQENSSDLTRWEQKGCPGLVLFLEISGAGPPFTDPLAKGSKLNDPLYVYFIKESRRATYLTKSLLILQ